MSVFTPTNISQICKDLQISYNTNILNDVDEFAKDYFKTVSETYINSGEGNATLMKLIINNYNMNMPIAQKISGPISLTVHRNERENKTFYIFGEYHNRLGECKSEGVFINDYLMNLFTTTNCFIDFYLEFPLEGELPGKYGHLYEVSNKLKHCVKNCPLVRMHNVDIRWVTENQKQVGRTYMGKMHFKISRRKLMIDSDDYENYEYLKKLFLDSEEDVINYILNNYKTSPLYIKEISKSSHKDQIYKWLHDITTKMVNRNYSTAKHALTEIYKYTNAKHRIYDRDLEATIDQYDRMIKNLTVTYNTFLMDGYALSRMFKKFNVKNANQPEYPHNIIVYVGDAHAENYRNFLYTMGYTVEASVINDLDDWDNRDCIDMKNIKQPFFSF